MRLPNQAKPVMRNAISHGQTNSGITPSDNCGCGDKYVCWGACVFGTCLGVCAPPIV